MNLQLFGAIMVTGLMTFVSPYDSSSGLLAALRQSLRTLTSSVPNFGPDLISDHPHVDYFDFEPLTASGHAAFGRRCRLWATPGFGPPAGDFGLEPAGDFGRPPPFFFPHRRLRCR